MSNPFEKLGVINNLIMLNVSDENNIGLLDGKMGISIYFFHLAHKTGNKNHQGFAEKLIDEVYEQLSANPPAMDFKNGLAGIAWGIEHLVQNGFVEADTDAILSGVDDKLYQHIVNNEGLPIGVMHGAMGFVLYILARLKGKELSPGDASTSTLIFKRLLVTLINRIGKMVEEKKIILTEPLLFNVMWDLPLCLILLSKVRKMNFYNQKIDRILEFLSPAVLSLFPHSQSNRLYLLLGLESVLQQVYIPGWRTHAGLLKDHIRTNEILTKDLKNKNIDFKHGVAGISFISRQLYQIIGNKNFLFKRNELTKKITASEYWKIIDQNKSGKVDLGLISGLAGISMELLQLIRIRDKSDDYKKIPAYEQ